MDLDVAGRSGPRLGGPRKDGVGEGFAPDAVPVGEGDELDDLGYTGGVGQTVRSCPAKTMPQVGGEGVGRAVKTSPAPALPSPDQTYLVPVCRTRLPSRSRRRARAWSRGRRRCPPAPSRATFSPCPTAVRPLAALWHRTAARLPQAARLLLRCASAERATASPSFAPFDAPSSSRLKSGNRAPAGAQPRR